MISVIIPVYNRGKLLEQAVNSICRTKYPNIEIIIVDDGSTDNTYDCARNLAVKYSDRIHVIRHSDKGNHGPGATRNLGIKIAKGDYICFLDSDDYFLPHRFETAVKILDSDSSIDGVYEWNRNYFLTNGSFSKGKFGPDHCFNPGNSDQLLGQMIKKGHHWHTDTILLRKAILDKIGGFSERIKTSEDLFLWLKLVCTANLVKGSDKPTAVYVVREPATGGRDYSLVTNPMFAYLEAFLWSKANQIDKDKQMMLKQTVISKLFYATDFFRKAQQPKIALILMFKIVRHVPVLVFRRLLWTNIFYGLKEYTRQGHNW